MASFFSSCSRDKLLISLHPKRIMVTYELPASGSSVVPVEDGGLVFPPNSKRFAFPYGCLDDAAGRHGSRVSPDYQL